MTTTGQTYAAASAPVDHRTTRLIVGGAAIGFAIGMASLYGSIDPTTDAQQTANLVALLLDAFGVIVIVAGLTKSTH